MRQVLFIVVAILILATGFYAGGHHAGYQKASWDIGYPMPKVQGSNLAWFPDDGDFVSGICESYDIDPNSDYYRISCPHCVTGGAFVCRLPDGSTVARLYYGPSFVVCAGCGYPLAHDWCVYKISPDHNSYTVKVVGSLEVNI
jgi:hypothetical protein